MTEQAKKHKQDASGIPNPHDSAFKSALSDVRVAREFFENYLPERIRSIVDLSELEIQSASFIDSELKTSASDILYKTSFAFEEKEPGYLYILAEHQSTSDYWLPLRILRYICRILEQHRKQHPTQKRLPLIVPLIFFTGIGGYKKSTDLFQLFGKHADLAKQLLFGPYTLTSLEDIQDDEILKHRWLGLMEMLMKHIFIRDTETLVKQMSKAFLASLLIEEGTDNYVSNMITYTFNLGNVSDIDVLIELIQTQLPKTVENKLMSIAQQFEQRGVEKGRRAGIRAGRRMGREEGVSDGLKKACEARKLFRSGMPLESIAQATGISQENLRELLD